jgi:hypothetical protein
VSFIRPIDRDLQYRLEVIEVWVPLVVLAGTGPSRPHDFLFDTGCQVTMVSEDVALALGLPPDDGTRRVRTVGLTGRGSGRLVDVRFRFPDTVSSTPGLEVSSTWVVVGGRTNLALLGFQEVHRHFRIWTFEFDMYFIRW